MVSQKNDNKPTPTQDENSDIVSTISTKFWKTDILDQEFLDLYNFNGIAFRGCNKYVGDVASDKYVTDNEQFEKVRIDLELDKKINYATQRAFVTGISYIFFGAPDGLELSEPLTRRMVPDFLQVIPKSWFILDEENNPQLNKSTNTYQIYKKGGGDKIVIHESRLIPVFLREDLKSSYYPAYRPLITADNNLWSGGQTNFRGAGGLTHVKITNPSKTKVSGKTVNEVDLVKTNGVFNNLNAETTFISDDRYEIAVKGAEGSRAPFKNIWETTITECSVALKIPIQLLLGTAAGALTGSETNLKDYFGEVDNVRQDFLTPIINQLVEMMGFQPLEITYDTLFEETDVEKSTIFKTTSEAISELVEFGTISNSSAVEELNNRFGTEFTEGVAPNQFTETGDSKHFKTKDAEFKFPYLAEINSEFTKEQADEIITLADLSVDDYELGEFGDHLYYQFRDFVPGTIEISDLNQNENIFLQVAEKQDELQESEAEKELRELKAVIRGFVSDAEKPFFPKLVPPMVTPWEKPEFIKLDKRAFNSMNKNFNNQFKFNDLAKKLKGAIFFIDSIGKDAEAEALIEISKEVDAFETNAKLALSPVLIDGIKAASEEAESILKQSVTITPRNIQIQKQIQEQAMDAVTGMSDSMRKDLKRELQAAMLNERSAQQAAKSFRNYVNADFANTYKNRMDVIAQQEMNNIYNSAAQANYEDSGVVDFNQWLHSGQSNGRPDHIAIHGQVVRVGEQFSIGCVRPPCGIRCKCAIAPYFPSNQ